MAGRRLFTFRMNGRCTLPSYSSSYSLRSTESTYWRYLVAESWCRRPMLSLAHINGICRRETFKVGSFRFLFLRFSSPADVSHEDVPRALSCRALYLSFLTSFTNYRSPAAQSVSIPGGTDRIVQVILTDNDQAALDFVDVGPIRSLLS